jgi:hypothetical protein
MTILWGHLNTLVYAAPVDNENALHHRIVRLSATTPASLNGRVWPWWDVSRCTSTLNPVEDILTIYYYSFICNSEIKCFRSHVIMDIFLSFGMCNSCPKFASIFQLHSVYTGCNFIYIQPVTVAARSKAWTVFAYSDAGIVGSNPT